MVAHGWGVAGKDEMGAGELDARSATAHDLGLGPCCIEVPII